MVRQGHQGFVLGRDVRALVLKIKYIIYKYIENIILVGSQFFALNRAQKMSMISNFILELFSSLETLAPGWFKDTLLGLS